jgi:hypothetical protein
MEASLECSLESRVGAAWGTNAPARKGAAESEGEAVRVTECERREKFWTEMF